MTLGGAITRYIGAHYGELVWAQYGIAGNHRYYNLYGYKNDFNLFGKWQQDLSSLIQIFTDLQYRRVNNRLNGFEHNADLYLHPKYNFFNPKIGLSYHKQDWLSYLSFSVANKEPIREDFQASLQQQPRPEHLSDIEAGVEHHFPAGKLVSECLIYEI
ncbi:MAG: hypothetical protein NVS1B13_15460 [Flavisolibacter sp.]